MEDELLIDCIRRYTFIYDPTEKGHADLRLLRNAWEEIAKTLGTSGKFVLLSAMFENIKMIINCRSYFILL